MTTYKIKRFGITITPGAKEVNAVPEMVTPAPNLPAVSSQALTGTVSMPGAGTKPGFWNNLPTAGKVGLGAAAVGTGLAVLGTGLAVHGLMKKKKKNNDQ